MCILIILDDIDNKYNNTCHRTIKMKPIDAKSSIYIYIDFDVENNDKDCKFKVADHMKIFVKCYAPNWSEEDFVNNKRARNTVP